MPNRLVRVLKNIKTRRGTHKQAFHVRKASPGDTYAQRVQPEIPDADPDLAQPVQDASGQPVEPRPDPEPRIAVEPLEIPWMLAGVGGAEPADPVPAELRKRFDPNNKMNRYKTPLDVNSPSFSVDPGEDLLWGSNERELLNRMRTGIITAAKKYGSSCNNLLCKIEGVDGIIERAYVRFDALADGDTRSLYGDMYSIEGKGNLSKRAAAAYELSKAVGMDDLVPPTVYKVDEHDGLEPIMSLLALEELASSLGKEVQELKQYLGSHSSIELWTDESHSMLVDPWIEQMSTDEAISLNDFYTNSPYRVALLRGAVFDFIAWTGSRTLADLVVCQDQRHPVHLVKNMLVFPDPVAMGTAYLEYDGSYTDGAAPSVQYAPMLWSDLVIQAALRGYDEDVRMYEDVAIECANRLRGDKVIDLIRSMNDHGISQLAIAATMVRVSFLRSGARVVMRNPLVVAQYFSSLLTGDVFDPGFDIDLESMENSVNMAMGKALVREFNFVSEMRGNGADQ